MSHRGATPAGPAAAAHRGWTVVLASLGVFMTALDTLVVANSGAAFSAVGLIAAAAMPGRRRVEPDPVTAATVPLAAASRSAA